MAYTVTNYPTKKALKEDFAKGIKISVFQPGPFGPNVADGSVCIEGPHYPKAHTWYASAVVKDGCIVSVK